MKKVCFVCGAETDTPHFHKSIKLTRDDASKEKTEYVDAWVEPTFIVTGEVK